MLSDVICGVVRNEFPIADLARPVLRELFLQVADVVYISELHFFDVVAVLQNSRRRLAVVHPLLQFGERVSFAYVVFAVVYRVHEGIDVVAVLAARYLDD